MFKIAILGCENSHADGFLKAIRDENLEDIQVMGVYSSFPGEAEDLHETFGVPVMENYDDLVGQLDGLIITARHGANHYKYAKPYLNDGIPMYIDKPITVSEEEAREFFKEITTRGIPVCGGGDPSYAKLLTSIPIMTYHGTEDDAVPVAGTRIMYASIVKEDGENISYTEYDGEGHMIWSKVYSDPQVIRWLFAQSREERRLKAEKKDKLKKAALAAGGGVGVLLSILLVIMKKRKK